MATTTLLAHAALDMALASSAPRRFLVVEASTSTSQRTSWAAARLRGLNASQLAWQRWRAESVEEFTKRLRRHRMPCAIDWLQLDLRNEPRGFLSDSADLVVLLSAHVRRVLVI